MAAERLEIVKVGLLGTTLGLEECVHASLNASPSDLHHQGRNWEYSVRNL